MWENLAEEVRECLRHAEECAARAKIEPHPAIQRDFIDMELRWLQLARSYQFLEGSLSLPGRVRPLIPITVPTQRSRASRGCTHGELFAHQARTNRPA